MIRADNLTKKYSGAAGDVTALNGISLHIKKGERVALLGRSGSGKTTLLNMLAGLDRPTSGSLTVGDRRLDQLSPAEMANYRSNRIGVVFQSFQLIPQRTALQNVELPLIINGVGRKERQQQAQEALRKVGLESRTSHRPFQMSGGEQQRVAIARAVLQNPPVLLADEPTGNLDSASTQIVMDLLIEIADSTGATLVIVTHDRQMANAYSTRIVELADGSICNAENGVPGESA